jgi:hypothetical protein
MRHQYFFLTADFLSKFSGSYADVSETLTAFITMVTVSMTMKEVSTSVMLVNFYQTT